MKTVLLFSVEKSERSRPHTALTAARYFTRVYWQEPRQLGRTRTPDDNPSAMDFQLRDGKSWYRVAPDGSGWLVSLIVPGDSAP